MDITDIRLRKITRDGKLRAMASITIDGVFVVHDIKVIEGDSGLFIAMPSRPSSDGDYRDIAHPITSATRQELQALIVAKYLEMEEEA
ncbi:MAG: septation regulator SpoVG [Lachnospiraceae bacterium]|jgi:stage V sporulation protein G|nr:septation regulator SpoVG [Lachnospiraceae bacterium]MBQ6545801.1 septation regulator SpoVG [Lachnospiraceae bacterium]